MNRTIEPKLTLPRVDANEAHALGDALITAVQAEKRLRSELAKEAKRLEEAHAAVAMAASTAVVFAVPKEVRKTGSAARSARPLGIGETAPPEISLDPQRVDPTQEKSLPDRHRIEPDEEKSLAARAIA